MPFYIKSVMLTDHRPKEQFIKVNPLHTFNRVVMNVTKDLGLTAQMAGCLHRDKKVIIYNPLTKQQCYVEICEGVPPGKKRIDSGTVDRNMQLNV